MTGSWRFRPLPHSLPPTHFETLSSYLQRLAHANYIQPRDLAEYLSVKSRGRRRIIGIDELSMVSGRSVTSLRLALPELGLNAGDHTSEIPTSTVDACYRCMASKGIYEPVDVWKRSDVSVCVKHHLWLGDGNRWNRAQEILNVSEVPAIIQAQKQHTRLVRKVGRSKVSEEFEIAVQIVHRLFDSRPTYDILTEKNLSGLLGEDWAVFPGDPAVWAAQYPRAVALTGFLVSPYWTWITSVRENLSFYESTQLDSIAAEIGKRLGIHYRLSSKDPIYRHLTDRLPNPERDALLNQIVGLHQREWPRGILLDHL